MTDLRLLSTADGGEVAITAGRFELDDSPATAAYLSLFGGNELDDGTTATERRQWWGNLSERDPARTLRSETQALLRSLPPVTSNLTRLGDAVRRDLAWLESELGAELSTRVRMTARDRVSIDIAITIDGAVTPLSLEAPWRTDG